MSKSKSDNLFKTIVGLNTRYYRNLRCMTQQELARACGLSLGYINEVEMGKKFPSADTLQKLIYVLEIAPEQLFSRNFLGNVSPVQYSEQLANYSKAVQMAKVVVSYVSEELGKYGQNFDNSTKTEKNKNALE